MASKLGPIGYKSGTNLALFLDQFQYILARGARHPCSIQLFTDVRYAEFDLKINPQICPFMPNLNHVGPKTVEPTVIDQKTTRQEAIVLIGAGL